MKQVLAILLLAIFLLNHSTAVSQDLEDYQWKNRIILLKDNNLSSDLLQKQLMQFEIKKDELDEQNVLVFCLIESTVYDSKLVKTSLEAKTLTSQYALSDFKGLLLLGKDGGIKLKKEFIVKPSEIFKLIDGMPMRIIEMRESKKID